MLKQEDIHFRPSNSFFFNSLFLKILIIYFFRVGEGRVKERERNIDVRETLIGCLWHTPDWGPGLQTQACDLIGNRTSDLSVHRLELSPLSHSSQN